MESIAQWLWLPVLGLVIAFIISQIRSTKARTEALQKIATMMNLTYRKDSDLTSELEATGFRLFRQGHSKKTSHVLTGLAGQIAIKIFDYRYRTGGGKNTHTSVQTVILMTSQRLDLPSFELQPENIFHKIGQVFGMKDIDFPMFPDFSKHYLLRGRDEEAVRNLFKTYVLEYFNRNKGLHLEGSANTLILYRSGKRISPQSLEAEYRKGLEICDLLKSYI